MNIGEAQHTQNVLTWLTELVTFEHRIDRLDQTGRSSVPDGTLIAAVTTLGDRAHAALGAGPTGDTYATALRRLLHLDATSDPDDTRDDLDPTHVTDLTDARADDRAAETVTLTGGHL